jgi:hypothetical protein
MQHLTLTPYQPTDTLEMDEEVHILIKSSDFENLEYKDDKLTFSIANRQFKKVIISTSTTEFQEISICFFGCFIEEVEIENINARNIWLGFYRCLLGGKIKSSNLRLVEINNSIINKGLFLFDVKRVSISNSEINTDMRRWREMFHWMGVSNLHFLLAQKQSYYIFSVKDFVFKSSIKYVGVKEKLNLHLAITYDNEIDDRSTSIENGYLRSLTLTGNSKGRIVIDNTKLESLYIYKFEPKSEAKLYNIQAIKDNLDDTKIGIHHCDLSNVWFDNFNFNQFDRISFYRSKFSKSLFTSCNFPKDYNIFRKVVIQVDNVHYPDKKGPNPDKDNYEMFLQLKASLDASGNYYEGQKLQAMAHAALKEVKDTPSSDKFILRLNSLSNKHALSITRPVLLFIGITIFLYISYLISIGQLYLNCSTEIDWKQIGYYFSFIDITHRNDFLNKIYKGDLTFTAQMIDYLNKLCMGYLIFQFISAFRKYSKK